ncbi:MAG: lipoyl(octanoyl) transferase LipB [Bacteroidota bacterium]
MLNKKVEFRNLGLIDYKEAWDYQENLLQEIIALKSENRILTENEKKATPNYLLFCEHPHVYTLGKSGSEDNLLVDQSQLNKAEATFYKINRGGDITYHGPGQLVAYPIFDLDNFFTDIHKYLRFLEEAVIQTIAEYGLKGERYSGFTGVWLDVENPAKARKICAMGVRCSRWVTMHGLALNVNTDLSYFKNIVPCGIDDKAVTSIEKEIGKKIDLKEVEENLKEKLKLIFEFEYVSKTLV